MVDFVGCNSGYCNSDYSADWPGYKAVCSVKLVIRAVWSIIIYITIILIINTCPIVRFIITVIISIIIKIGSIISVTIVVVIVQISVVRVPIIALSTPAIITFVLVPFG